MSGRRQFRGSALVEYVIPTAILVVAVGLGLYYISSNGNLLQGFISSSGGSQDLASGKISIGSLGVVDGVYKDSKGNTVLCNKGGSCIYINESYYNKYSEQIKEKLEDNSFESNSSSMVGTETSGSVGVTDIAKSDDSSLKNYALLLDIAAENNTDANAQELLGDLSTYGARIDEIEDNLLETKKEVDAIVSQHKEAQAQYIKAKEVFEDTLKSLKGLSFIFNNSGSSTDLKTLSSAFDNMRTAYDTYSEIRDTAQGQLDNYLSFVDSEFSDLKDNNRTGYLFDETIVEIENSISIDQDTKDTILPISKKMSAVKDSVAIIKDDIESLIVDFDDEFLTFEELKENTMKEYDVSIDYSAGDEEVADEGTDEGNEGGEGNGNSENNEGNNGNGGNG